MVNVFLYFTVLVLIFCVICFAKETKISAKYLANGLRYCRVYGMLIFLGFVGILFILWFVINFFTYGDGKIFGTNEKIDIAILIASFAAIIVSVILYRNVRKKCPEKFKKKFLFDLFCIGSGLVYKVCFVACVLAIIAFLWIIRFIFSLTPPEDDDGSKMLAKIMGKPMQTSDGRTDRKSVV